MIEYQVTCPVCKETRTLTDKQYYGKVIKKFGSADNVMCYSCSRKSKSRVPLNCMAVCPDCGEEREVSTQTYKNALKKECGVDENNAVLYRCTSCGYFKRREERLQEEKFRVEGPVTLNGCVLEEVKRSSRCAKYAECEHFLDCLDFSIKAQWKGWKAQS